MSWHRRQRYYGRDAYEWGELFLTLILLVIILTLVMVGLGLLLKIMWKLFMFGWGLV